MQCFYENSRETPGNKLVFNSTLIFFFPYIGCKETTRQRRVLQLVYYTRLFWGGSATRHSNNEHPGLFLVDSATRLCRTPHSYLQRSLYAHEKQFPKVICYRLQQYIEQLCMNLCESMETTVDLQIIF